MADSHPPSQSQQLCPLIILILSDPALTHSSFNQQPPVSVLWHSSLQPHMAPSLFFSRDYGGTLRFLILLSLWCSWKRPCLFNSLVPSLLACSLSSLSSSNTWEGKPDFLCVCWGSRGATLTYFGVIIGGSWWFGLPYSPTTVPVWISGGWKWGPHSRWRLVCACMCVGRGHTVCVCVPVGEPAAPRSRCISVRSRTWHSLWLQEWGSPARALGTAPSY